jgi:hypothetical protein
MIVLREYSLHFAHTVFAFVFAFSFTMKTTAGEGGGGGGLGKENFDDNIPREKQKRGGLVGASSERILSSLSFSAWFSIRPVFYI